MKSCTVLFIAKIIASSEQDSQIVNVAMQDEDQGKAADIANETANVLQEEIGIIMNVEVKENAAPEKPQPLLNIAIAMAAD
ncbi:hypothetical protein NLX67_03080 [Domibacillus sp. A3M-37]|uniref:hypothetical protein n=1 Tax=Domibacillus sp. A3M-37 TaxID=2962037 RepID=UPI0020B68B05|nr:hypothetical protein [Domibacillus sp. A3M-37]MCP3761374.1 hypothetical protein [Domibacillus sp. A3M-37]